MEGCHPLSLSSVSIALQLEFGSSPVTPFSVVTNFVASLHANPLRNRPVLLLLLAQHPLDAESFVRRHLSPLTRPKTKGKKNTFGINQLYQNLLMIVW